VNNSYKKFYNIGPSFLVMGSIIVKMIILIHVEIKKTEKIESGDI